MVGIQASGNTALHSLPGILSQPSPPPLAPSTPCPLGSFELLCTSLAVVTAGNTSDHQLAGFELK